MDTADVQTQNEKSLIELIREEKKASKGYKAVSIIHIVAKILFGIAVAVTAIVALIVNGVIGLIMSLSGATDIFSRIWELLVPCCGPILTVCIIYTVLVSTPIYLIKQIILKRRVANKSYDAEETVIAFRETLVRTRERKSTEEAFLEGVGWNILVHEYMNKGFFSKLLSWFFAISGFISMIVMMVLLRVGLLLYSLSLINSTNAEWAIGIMLVVLVLLVAVSWIQTARNKKVIERMQESINKKAEESPESDA